MLLTGTATSLENWRTANNCNGSSFPRLAKNCLIFRYPSQAE
ncbi:hypothetical protein [Microcoleus sp. FACHB-831]|nr:hypothetical protein [Microcoleus sp. FACHB-831]